MHLSVPLYLHIVFICNNNSRASRPAHETELSKRDRRARAGAEQEAKKKLHSVNCLHSSTIVCFSRARYFILLDCSADAARTFPESAGTATATVTHYAQRVHTARHAGELKFFYLHLDAEQQKNTLQNNENFCVFYLFTSSRFFSSLSAHSLHCIARKELNELVLLIAQNRNINCSLSIHDDKLFPASEKNWKNEQNKKCSSVCSVLIRVQRTASAGRQWNVELLSIIDLFHFVKWSLNVTL